MSEINQNSKITLKGFIGQTYFLLKQDKLIFYANTASFVLILISFLLLVFRLNNLPSQVPLFYSLPWGEDQLAKPKWLFILPLASLVVFVFNFFWSIFFIRKESLLAKILSIGSLFVGFLFFYTLTRIILLIS